MEERREILETVCHCLRDDTYTILKYMAISLMFVYISTVTLMYSERGVREGWKGRREKRAVQRQCSEV